MKKNLTIILLLFTTFCVGQSISSALSHDRPYDIKDSIQVIELTKTTKYYRKNGIEKKKSIITFNNKNRLKTERRFDENGKLKARLTFKYDSTNTRTESRKFETWNKILGYNSEIAEYEYDSKKFLTKITDKNSKNQIFRITSLVNNDKGHPIKLFLESRNFKGQERAKYDYKKNEVMISVLKENGDIFSESKTRFNFHLKKFPDLKYNEFGDLIESKNRKYSYKYDKNKNWIKKTNYELKNGKWKKYQIVTRKIKYKKL